MTQPTSNLRVRRMQKLLREALIDLIEERGFDALTVGELTERAMISRAAFYRNYQDKYDLVEQIFEEAMSTLLKAVGEMGPRPHHPPGQHHPPEPWVKFFEHIVQYERLYRTLLGNKGSTWFVKKMRASLSDMVMAIAHEHGHIPKGQVTADQPFSAFIGELVPDLVSTMLVEAITLWLEQGRPSTPREMATRCTQLASALFKEVSTWHDC
jgi:AcrR family transcriptional regulator